MRRAAPDAVRTPPELALIARVSPRMLKRQIPIALVALDPFSEPEPSEGAAIELASGRHVIVVYGLQTERLYVHAAWPEALQSVADFLREAAIDRDSVEWADSRLSSLKLTEHNEALLTRP
jgi:hypothetical protein